MAIHEINGDTAHVNYDAERAFWGCMPWVATWDSYDPTPIDYDTPAYNPVGEGMTEKEALYDLLEQTDGDYHD
jgi:hypothetical protein